MACADSDCDTFVEPGNVVTLRARFTHAGVPPARLPQMPAYHHVRGDRAGITMVNIGVGPANAKNITDHIAVLRPHAWLMLGHCAGLRTTQQLGDSFVIGNSCRHPVRNNASARAAQSRWTWSRRRSRSTASASASEFPTAPALRVRQALAWRDQAAGHDHHFYRARVEQHLRIGIGALGLLRGSSGKLHSRKLRGFAEVAFH